MNKNALLFEVGGEFKYRLVIVAKVFLHALFAIYLYKIFVWVDSCLTHDLKGIESWALSMLRISFVLFLVAAELSHLVRDVADLVKGTRKHIKERDDEE